MEIRVGGKYRLGKKIGSGSFGEIYQVYDIQTNQVYAVKLESIKAKFPQLQYESQIYKIMQGGGEYYVTILVGIPQLHYFGIEKDYNIMVIDQMGPSLEDFFEFCNRKFSLKTIIMIAEQLVDMNNINLGNKSIIHRDIKPENFLLGLDSKSKLIYIIDYGLAKKYRDPKTGQHIPFKENKNLTGTARYASLFTHLGYEQSRRDDLESIGYLIMYFLRGSLPWQGARGDNKKEKYERIKTIKQNTTMEKLTEGFPEEFTKYMNYCRKLKFEERPDYCWIKTIFRELFFRIEIQWDFVYDWVIINNNKQNQNQTIKTKNEIIEQEKINKTLQKYTN